jgi:hypothetical protein
LSVVQPLFKILERYPDGEYDAPHRVQTRLRRRSDGMPGNDIGHWASRSFAAVLKACLAAAIAAR